MSSEIKTFSRQEFNRFLGAVLVGFVISQTELPDDSSDQEINTIIPSKTFSSIFGIHDAARIGGSYYLDTMIKQLQPLKPRYMVGLNPRPDWYQKVQEIGATPLVRLIIPNQQDNPAETKKQLSTVPPGTRVVPRNETNLRGETGNIPMMPQTAAEYDLKSFKLISERGCIPIFTPTSPEGWLQNIQNQNVTDHDGNPYYETHYYESYMQHHAELGTFRDFPEAEIGLHAYDFQFHSPDAENMWDRISRFNRDIILPYAGKRPIHVLEGGMFLADVPQSRIDYKKVGIEISKLMASDLPLDIADQLQSFAYWIYAVDAQTTAVERQNQDSRFEKTALVQLIKKSDSLLYSAPNPMYQAIYQYQQTH